MKTFNVSFFVELKKFYISFKSFNDILPQLAFNMFLLNYKFSGSRSYNIVPIKKNVTAVGHADYPLNPVDLFIYLHVYQNTFG